MDESTQNEYFCPRCGIPGYLQAHVGSEECKYAEGLKEKADERDKAVAMMKRWIYTRSNWQIRAEKAEAALRKIAEYAPKNMWDAAIMKEMAREALEADDE